MPEHTPISRSISRSYVVRMRSRCASSSLSCSSNHCEPLGELRLDALDRRAHVLVGRDVVRRREQHEPVELLDHLAGERIDRADALDLVAEELDAHRPLLVRREHLDRVAPDPELVAQ